MSYTLYVMARINARLDDALARKLEDIRRRTGQSTTDVVLTAIEQYHERLEPPAGSRAAAIFEETGFLGCADGPRELADAYKSYLDFSQAELRGPLASYGAVGGPPTPSTPATPVGKSTSTPSRPRRGARKAR
jgi:predicted transcriptional regulator